VPENLIMPILEALEGPEYVPFTGEDFIDSGLIEFVNVVKGADLGLGAEGEKWYDEVFNTEKG
jgi:hypothetical protein